MPKVKYTPEKGFDDLDRERYEDDLYKSFLDEDEPCHDNRKAFLLALAVRHPDRWAAFAKKWPKQVKEDASG